MKCVYLLERLTNTSKYNPPLLLNCTCNIMLNNESFEIWADNLSFTPGKDCDSCDLAIVETARAYAYYHGYVAIVVCFFGTIANVLNVIVLTRKDMACAPINRILTWLAVADMMLMVEYMLFAYYYNIDLPDRLNFPFWAAVLMLFHGHFSQILHTISICLTLALAVWRYLAVG